jgi:hypothetical protein
VILAIALPIAAVAASLFLYRLRGIHPFWYGFIEIAVGLIVLIFTFVPTTHYLASDSQTFFERGVTKLIGVMAGVYIIIRGLDNAAIASTCCFMLRSFSSATTIVLMRISSVPAISRC